MTQEHPITPPPELVEQWMAEIWHEGTPVRVSASDLYVATQSARWGSDQELKACCVTLQRHAHWDLAVCELWADRRPNPPSLKEQALDMLSQHNDGCALWNNYTLRFLQLMTDNNPITPPPEPPSLKEQALECLKNINDACESEGFSRSDDTDIIRRALESLPD